MQETFTLQWRLVLLDSFFMQLVPKSAACHQHLLTLLGSLSNKLAQSLMFSYVEKLLNTGLRDDTGTIKAAYENLLHKYPPLQQMFSEQVKAM